MSILLTDKEYNTAIHRDEGYVPYMGKDICRAQAIKVLEAVTAVFVADEPDEMLRMAKFLEAAFAEVGGDEVTTKKSDFWECSECGTFSIGEGASRLHYGGCSALEGDGK